MTDRGVFDDDYVPEWAREADEGAENGQVHVPQEHRVHVPDEFEQRALEVVAKRRAQAEATGAWFNKIEQPVNQFVASLCKPRRCTGMASRKGKCETIVHGYYLCDRCASLMSLEDQDVSFSAAIDSIPQRYRWATRTHAQLINRVVGAGNSIRPTMAALEDNTTWVFITGAQGTGKSSLACAAIRDVIRQAKDNPKSKEAHARAKLARYFQCSTLSNAKTEWGRNQGTPPDLTMARRCKFLVLDDLGKEKEPRVIVDVIDERHAHGLQTIVTTMPFTLEDYTARYGEQMMQRLFKNGTGVELRDPNEPTKRS